MIELIGFLLSVGLCFGEAVTFSGVPDDDSLSVEISNAVLLNKTLQSLQPGDTFIVPNQTFWLMGGIVVENIENVVIQIDGTLFFSSKIDNWPTFPSGQVFECLQFTNVVNVTWTSSGAGYAVRGENRPRLINIGGSSNLIFENIYLIDSPYWTFWGHEIDTLVIRYSHVHVARDNYDGHDWDDLSAFNTDGFDVSGRNIHIHDCTIWNQDDCIAVKDNNDTTQTSENILVERVNGLTIGSIGNTTVRNVTFRDSFMHHTYKANGGVITDILYENIVIQEPEQWAIWIGPAQQADSADICHASPCSLCWPDLEDLGAQCNAPDAGIYSSITLRNITIINPLESPGVIIGSPTFPMSNIVFDNVVFQNPPTNGWWGTDYFYCKGVESGTALGATWPVPPCFLDLTDKNL